MGQQIQNIGVKTENKYDSKYKSIIYTEDQNAIWKHLYTEQLRNLKSLGSENFLNSLESLNLPDSYIPQLSDVSAVMRKATGWTIAPVDGLITSELFFTMLANRQFPSTTYIRNSSELTLSRDPDIFHELFGHCSILMDPFLGDIVQEFGKLALEFSKKQWPLLLRLFWFTMESGLVNTPCGLKIYGGSVASSIREAYYAIHSLEPVRKPFALVEIFRTPYRADKLQNCYFIINSFEELYNAVKDRPNIYIALEKAYELGEYFPLFTIDENAKKYTSINHLKLFAENLLPERVDS